ncbi:hypothetical protein SCOCK_20036 [Actinacidiphila cocklensis]|uniref:Uncharacterized protein n=1 Tax=Actinacidiphila cocklensis TaxID=887465 RepID=A0A9W4DN38_9ACTN|nr:hypothetical protein SCOCK_20036 [Actinacidiphila cocklensis]
MPSRLTLYHFLWLVDSLGVAREAWDKNGERSIDGNRHRHGGRRTGRPPLAQLRAVGAARQARAAGHAGGVETHRP